MRRFLLTACLMLMTSVLHAQSVNLQPPIDFEEVKQNSRITTLEEKVESLSMAMEKIVVPALKANERMVSVLDRIESRLPDLQKPPAKAQAMLSGEKPPAPEIARPKAEIDARTFRQVEPGVLENDMGERIVTNDSARVQINRINIPPGYMAGAVPIPVPDPVPNAVAKTSVTSQRASVSSNYAPKWHNTDGKSLRQHIIDEHGGSPSMSDAELYAMHDAWHNANGGAPPSARSRTVAKVTVKRSAPRVQRVRRAAAGGCPGGACPYRS